MRRSEEYIDYERREEDDDTFYGNSTIGTAPTPTNRSTSRGRSRERIQPSTTTTSVKSSQHYNTNSSRYAVVDREEIKHQRDSSPDYKQDLQYIRRSVDMVDKQGASSAPASPSRVSSRSKYLPPPSSQYPPLPSHLLDTTNPLSNSLSNGLRSVNSSVNNLFADTFSSTTTTAANPSTTLLGGGHVGSSTNTNPLYFSGGTAPGSLLFPRVEELLVVKKDLEDRLVNAEMKYKILQEQIQSMPASINIAQVCDF